MLTWNKINKFVCERCKSKVTEIHFWDDGTYTYICKDCKEDLESGGIRKLPRNDEVLV